MKKTIGIITLLFTFGLTSIGQVSVSKNANDFRKKGNEKAQKKIDAKAEEVSKKARPVNDAKKAALEKAKEGKEQAKQISQEAKKKYLSMKDKDIENLPLAEKAVAKKAVFEKKVNTSDMKSASAQMKISGVKTRLKNALEAGTISEAEYKTKMEKVAAAEQSLKAYRTSIKKGKLLLK